MSTPTADKIAEDFDLLYRRILGTLMESSSVVTVRSDHDKAADIAEALLVAALQSDALRYSGPS